MAAVYLFTWNLGKNAGARVAAHALTVDHLAYWGKKHPFIACMQELPGDSLLAKARRKDPAAVAALAAQNIAVVATSNMVKGVALACRADLSYAGAHADEDDEFLTAIFRLPSSTKQVRVVGLHAQSKGGMQRPEDQGGSRALLRHAINDVLQRTAPCDHTVILGDFNSPMASQEVQSWNCFYAVSENRPRTGPTNRRRRGLDHPPLYAVAPPNRLTGTYVHDDTSGTASPVIDFIAVDEGTLPGASSRILTAVATKPVWDHAEERPNLSDHLPVEGFVDI